jgi:TctA family transporter
MALMMGAMMIHNVFPGPRVMTSDPIIFWGLIASMWIGNLMLLIINLPMISVWVWMLKVRYSLLYPVILVFCCVGVYSLQNDVFDVYLAVFFGALGHLFYRMKCEPAPLLLGFILGPLMEENLRRAMLISKGNPSVFVTSPLSLAMLLSAAVLLAIVLLPSVRRKRSEVFAEES